MSVGRNFLWFCAILLTCPFAPLNPGSASAADNSHCIYRSPLPGSSLVSAGTNLIMRFDRPVAASSLSNARMQVVGSTSGIATGTLSLSDDGHTVLYQPSRDFVGGETVNVKLGGMFTSTDGMDLGSLDWQFSISAGAIRPAGVTALASLEKELALTPNPHAAPSGIGLQRATGDLPSDFPSRQVTIDSATLAGGIFLSNIAFDKTIQNTPYLMVLDGTGNPLFYRELPALGFDFKRHENGQYTYFLTTDIGFVVLDSSFQQVTHITAKNGYTSDLHELRLLPNGHALLLATDPETVDMSRIVSGGASDAQVTGNILQELDQSGNVVFQWRSWDHFKITDATLTDFTASQIDPVHANAIELDGDGNILLSSRHLDEITKINRATGDIIWRLGGKNNQFTLLGDTLWFSHQHAIRRLANGHYVVFDNGNGHIPQFSRAIEFVLDTVAMTCRFVWQFARTGTFSPAMGYVQRLDDGNTLIGWGATAPAVSVVTPEGKVVYELWFPNGVYSYRAILELWSPPPGFANRGNVQPTGFTLHQNYPNPFNTTTIIEYETPYSTHVTLTVYDALGQEVAILADRTEDQGMHYALFSGTGLATGVYFCQLRAGSYAETRKLLLIR